MATVAARLDVAGVCMGVDWVDLIGFKTGAGRLPMRAVQVGLPTWEGVWAWVGATGRAGRTGACPLPVQRQAVLPQAMPPGPDAQRVPVARHLLICRPSTS